MPKSPADQRTSTRLRWVRAALAAGGVPSYQSKGISMFVSGGSPHALSLALNGIYTMDILRCAVRCASSSTLGLRGPVTPPGTRHVVTPLRHPGADWVAFWRPKMFHQGKIVRQSCHRSMCLARSNVVCMCPPILHIFSFSLFST